MPVEYTAPQEDMRFVLQQLIDAEAIRQLPGYEEFSADLVEAILEEAGKFASGVISPLNHISDEKGATLLPGHMVQTSPGFKEAYQQYV
ncbi:MAG: acyl-CoA dehydrogenase N-terminal domain-containing protein, partial [Burkholderiaceae bacterium]|nr:acyl-CoA dehydrogenase N-terminal domain-containing protein [Burkholderiaceae bacterium]